MSGERMLEAFGERLRQARLATGKQQTQVAWEAALPSSQISHYESGSREPNLVNLRRLCVALAVSADTLLGLHETLEHRMDMGGGRGREREARTAMTERGEEDVLTREEDACSRYRIACNAVVDLEANVRGAKRTAQNIVEAAEALHAQAEDDVRFALAAYTLLTTEEREERCENTCQ